MKYIFRGNLSALICPECPEKVSQATVRLYRLRKDQEGSALATASPKDTFAILTEEEIKKKESYLIAEAKTGDDGDYRFELGEKQEYNGEAFEIDVYLENVPDQKMGKKKTEPLQFTITTLQPQWKIRQDVYTAIWDYVIPHRFWCFIRSKFYAWVICGRVLDCQQQPPVPVPGVKVIAFDRDWLQDDEIGSSITDGSGKFRIDYTISDFEKTPFSPWINLELIPGPDLYFRVEAFDSTPLLIEPPSRGRDADRENVGPCFCVQLCVDEPIGDPGDYPYFTHVGDFNIAADIDALTGLTNKAKFGHGGPDFGFFHRLKFKGFVPKTLPGDPTNPLHYRFLYVHPDDPVTEVPVVGSLVPGTTPSQGLVVGARVIPWDLMGTGPVPAFQDVILLRSGAASPPDSLPTPPAVPPGTPWGSIPPHIIIPDSDGWVRVDQSPNLLDDGFQGALMAFRSPVAVPGGTAPGPGAGNDPAGVARNGKLLRIIFETATDPANPATINRQLLEAIILVNNWVEVRELNLQQFIGPTTGSCTGLTSDI